MPQKPRRLATLVLAAAVSAAATVHGQSAFTPPPDVAEPPADAVKSQTGLASKMLTPGKSAEKPEASDIVTVDYTGDRKSTRLNSSHGYISYAVFCLKK